MVEKNNLNFAVRVLNTVTCYFYSGDQIYRNTYQIEIFRVAFPWIIILKIVVIQSIKKQQQFLVDENVAGVGVAVDVPVLEDHLGVEDAHLTANLHHVDVVR